VLIKKIYIKKFKCRAKSFFSNSSAILCIISPLLEEHLNNAGLVKPYKNKRVGRIAETPKSAGADGSQEQHPNVIHETVDATDQHNSVQNANLPVALIDEGFKIAFGLVFLLTIRILYKNKTTQQKRSDWGI